MNKNFLYDHQQKIIEADPKKCGLFFGTGSGKTTIALILARKKTLVIVPKTLKEQESWQKEKMRLGLNIDLTVMSKEDFKKNCAYLPKFNTIIADEAHQILGATPNLRWRHKKQIPKVSQICEAFYSYIIKHQPERIYLVTATITRNPMVVWATGIVLGRKWSFREFRERFYFKLPMVGREIWMQKKDEKAKKELGEIVRSLGYTGKLDDFFTVPEQEYKTIYVDLTEEQENRIAELDYIYPDPLVKVGKQHQIENGVIVGNQFKESEYLFNKKNELLKQYVKIYPRMIIFAKYIDQLEYIYLDLKPLVKKILLLTGQTKNRKVMLEEANQAKECIFLCQASMGVGWELPSYPVVVFASMSYSIVDKIQSEGRVLRANALKENTFITLISKGGVDEEVKNCIDNKQDFIEKTYAREKFSNPFW